jgi:putative hydrolase
MRPSFNARVADLLRQMGNVLEQQQANPFRINAYINAADAIDQLDMDVRELLEHEGTEGLVRLPYIGTGIASSIRDIANTGQWPRLERLRGTLQPEKLLRTVPGIGPDLAHAIHEQLHVETLEALEIAAHDGRLQTVKGVAQRRAAAIRASLAAILGSRRTLRQSTGDGPGVRRILSVDDEYRTQAAAGMLKKIAPRRFNPAGEAWLSILHTQREDWHFTAMYSNTARAHELGRTNDWVVIYFYDGDHEERQCTVVNEKRGPLRGRRVVRGQETECERYYAHH